MHGILTCWLEHLSLCFGQILGVYQFYSAFFQDHKTIVQNFLDNDVAWPKKPLESPRNLKDIQTKEWCPYVWTHQAASQWGWHPKEGGQTWASAQTLKCKYPLSSQGTSPMLQFLQDHNFGATPSKLLFYFLQAVADFLWAQTAVKVAKAEYQWQVQWVQPGLFSSCVPETSEVLQEIGFPMEALTCLPGTSTRESIPHRATGIMGGSLWWLMKWKSHRGFWSPAT